MEAEIQKNKARQIFLDNLYVVIAMILIVILAVVCVILKVIFFPDEKIITFIPLTQQVKPHHNLGPWQLKVVQAGVYSYC